MESNARSTVFKTKWIIITTIITLMVVAMVAVISVSTTVGPTLVEDHEFEVQDHETFSQKMDRLRQLHTEKAKNGVKHRRSSMYTTCSSEMNNETVPAAHIQGYKLWKQTATNSANSGTREPLDGYVTSWKCVSSSGTSFVDGGMKFSGETKALIVPKCGYYYFSSSVTFFLKPIAEVFHKMSITRNCSSTDVQKIDVIGYSSSTKNNSRITTYTDNVILLCAGSTVQVVIPSKVPCCGYGAYSYMNGFLVAEANCTTPHAKDHAMLVY